ncbi:MAG: ATP-binding protein [Gallionella sp.]|nr:ATP-binding protein [Gallionella sp.]
MTKAELLQNALMGLVVTIMLGVLAFLYHKTEAVNLREQNEVMSLLAEVKEVDVRWDREVQRLRNDPNAPQLPVSSHADAGEKALRDITRFARLTSRASLRSGLTDLRNTILLKSDLFQQFKAADQRNRETLRALLANIAQLESLAASQKSSHAEIEQALVQLAKIAPTYFSQGDPEVGRALTQNVNTLRSRLQSGQDLANKVEQDVASLLANIPPQQEMFVKFSTLTSGPRLTNLSLSFNAELEDALQEKELYRIYLIYYAAALLVLLAYLGVKLKAANQTLEHRVEARTRDLSDALKHLKESEAQLIQSEKMSSLGQMVAGVAHEINTPLAYVKNSLGRVAEQMPHIMGVVATSEKLLSLLKAGNDPQALSATFQQATVQIDSLKQQHALEELDGLVKDGIFGTQQVAEIVGNLKNFSRLDRSKVAHFNLNDGLNSTLLLGKHLLKSVIVDKRFGDIPEITCSPSQINQVFLNLVTNAVQAMPDERGTLTLVSRVEGDGVAIEVQDNGKGIPPEVMTKIFDPFFTTKEIGKGTGLGLSISYKIVQQHGGRIKVESTPDVGTKFTVWLPLTPPADSQLEG